MADKQTLGDIVKEYFPEADEDFMEFVIWAKTGYPCFWNIPKDGNTPEECFRKQLQDFKDELQVKGQDKEAKE